MLSIAGRQKSINWQHWQQLQLISPCLASRGCGLFNPPGCMPCHFSLFLSLSFALHPFILLYLSLRANKKALAASAAAIHGAGTSRRSLATTLTGASRFIATGKYSIIFICLYLVFLHLLRTFSHF